MARACRSIEIDGWEQAIDACGLLIKAEALDVYRDALAETPELFEEGTRRRLALAAHVDADALRALRLEQLRFAETVELALSGVDLLLLPTIPVDAPAADGADAVATIRRRRLVHAPAELRPSARPVDPVRRDVDGRADRRPARVDARGAMVLSSTPAPQSRR